MYTLVLYLSHRAHESHHIGYIMLRQQLRRQRIALFERHVEERTRVRRTGGAGASHLHGSCLQGELFGLETNRTL
jgi:hypothetical protein